MRKQIKKWLGLSTAAEKPMAEPKEQNDISNEIWRLHAALDKVYGVGWSKENPGVVAMFMHAINTQNMATEVAILREIIGSGTGAITIGIDKS